MEAANPEVKLALTVERRLRRPAGHLRAMLAAAEREVRDETPGEALLAGPDPLTVLAALLEAPAPGAASDPLRGPARRAWAPAAAEARRALHPAATGVGSRRSSAAPRPASGIGRHGTALDRPDGSDMTGAARVLPLAATGKASDRAAIAQARAVLRRSLGAPPEAAGGAQRLHHDAPPAGSTQPDELHRADALAPHALVAAARASEAASRSGEAAARSAEAAGVMASLAGTVLQAADGLAPLPSAPLSSIVPEPIDGRRTEASAGQLPPTLAPTTTYAPAAQTRAALPPTPAPAPRSRVGLMPALDDDADALSEAAWRNGVDLT